MGKKFKKNQPIIATLPTGRVVEGIYIEPYGDNGHSFYVNEFNGMCNGKPIYKKTTYGVKEEFIDAADTEKDTVSVNQYKAWLKRAIILENRIGEDKRLLETIKNSKDKKKETEKLGKKIERNNSKLNQINYKIKMFEKEMD
jgi:hypothetical protein